MKNSLKKEEPPDTIPGLNEEQALAVNSIRGPVLVLAGPGTGKTQLLSIRASFILKKDRKILPENILILTYTNSAAKTMKERLAKVIGADGYDVEIATFHGFANSILQESEEAAEYVGDRVQMDDVEQVKAVKYILDNTKGLDEIRPFGAPYMYIKELLQKMGDLKKDGIKPGDLREYAAKNKSDGYLEEKHIKRLKCLSVVYDIYEKLKEGKSKEIFDERGRYDYDDMILFATEALKRESPLKEKYRAQFKYVMVDEFQDTNGAQLELLFALLDHNDPNLCCVGDDDQSIYRFQGASVGNFKLFRERFPHLKEISLKDNYRSTEELLNISKNIIGLIPIGERMAEKDLVCVKDYPDKEIGFREFTTEDEELLFIVEKIKELRDRIASSENLSAEERAHPLNNIAILVRKRKSILKIIDSLLQAGIPYATDGKEDISGEMRVKQLIDVLLLSNYTGPDDMDAKDAALYRVLTSDYLEIPHPEVLKFLCHVNEKKEKRVRKVSLMGEFFDYFSSHKASYAIRRLLDDAQTKTVHTTLLNYIKDSGLFRYILKEYADKNILRIRDLRSVTSFINMIKTADLANPGMRLGDLMLDMKTRSDHDLPIQGKLVTMTQDGVRIYTAHGSKGQEFHSVIIPFCLEKKNWPARAIPEKIPLPASLFKTKERIKERESLKRLAGYDETRLFYVAVTRSRSTLLFTASPTENTVSSSYLNHLDIPKESSECVDEEELLGRSIDLTDMEDPFIGTEAILKDMISSLSLNPTRVNNYLSCRRKFLYNDVLKLPAAKKRSLVFGNSVHKALEETYKEFKRKIKFPDFKFFLKAFEDELKMQGADSSIELDCLNKANGSSLREWFEGVSKDPVMPIDLEKKLMITLADNIIFTGKYDKVEWQDRKNNMVRIIDYKTGKPDDHLKKIGECRDLRSEDCDGYLRQLVCYKLLYEKDRSQSRGKTASHGVLVFIEPVSADVRKLDMKKGSYISLPIQISEEMVAEMEKIIIDTWSDIKSLKFEKLAKRDEEKCARCDYDDICWSS
ncbi:MAG: ATP-dependent DNA helicase [Candidatus Omnitrophota bacterium]|nr:ATP-dependent DNA helicase [Candidatus Omnitrophota bacterium]